jgi:hypothetical protein
MIICALKEQLDMLLSVKTFEVHLKASLLRHDTLYEVVFMAYQDASGSGKIPLCTTVTILSDLDPCTFAY